VLYPPHFCLVLSPLTILSQPLTFLRDHHCSRSVVARSDSLQTVDAWAVSTHTASSVSTQIQVHPSPNPYNAHPQLSCQMCRTAHLDFRRSANTTLKNMSRASTPGHRHTTHQRYPTSSEQNGQKLLPQEGFGQCDDRRTSVGPGFCCPSFGGSHRLSRLFIPSARCRNGYVFEV
jgi:hypothetical protein